MTVGEVFAVKDGDGKIVEQWETVAKTEYRTGRQHWSVEISPANP